ncbi:hypothetical protein DL769_007903 [Monosporascus sp. CRB-8-3]|nr:hypothetical protein DL769_007903 [Monosporascus sp. CRB-8-3]
MDLTRFSVLSPGSAIPAELESPDPGNPWRFERPTEKRPRELLSKQRSTRDERVLYSRSGISGNGFPSASKFEASSARRQKDMTVQVHGFEAAKPGMR